MGYGLGWRQQELTLGSKATKLMGAAKKIALNAEVTARRGKQFAGFRQFRFTLTR
jgi:hypothetical protein